MNSFWWQLPGPSRFVSRIVDNLRRGKNVILYLPKHLPSGLARAVRYVLGDDDYSWDKISVSQLNQQAQPAHLLFNRFGLERSPDAICNANTLSQHEDFAEKVIWLDGINQNVWSAWKEFLVDYEHACQSYSLRDRTLFCVPLIGELALDSPPKEVGLSHHDWRGSVDSLDMLLYTTSLFQRKQLSALQKRVAVSVVANLALWDADVSERLAFETLENILNPVLVLQAIARERGWCTDDDSSSKERWCRGIIDTFEGEDKIHSAALALNDLGKKEIEKRIWSAEVGVMLPFVEERRREIIECLTGVLKIPFSTRFGEVIKDLRDLEIGHIEYQVSSNGVVVNSDMERLVRRLREIRNALSHLEPISPELLLCREISDWHRILRGYF